MEDGSSLILPIVFLGAGVLFIVLAIPLIKGQVPPNTWYGFKTPKTLSDPEIWYKINRDGGRALLVAGVVIAVVSIGVPLCVLKLPGGAAWRVVVLALTLVGGGALIRGLWNLPMVPVPDGRSEAASRPCSAPATGEPMPPGRTRGAIWLCISVVLWIAALFVIGACFYPYLPERMGTHWSSFDGQADGFSSRAVGAFVLPAIAIPVSFMLAGIRIGVGRVDERAGRFLLHLLVATMILLTYLHMGSLLWNVGIRWLMGPAIGVVLVAFVGFVFADVAVQSRRGILQTNKSE